MPTHTHPLTLSHSQPHAMTHPLIHSLTHPRTRSPTHSRIHSPTHALTLHSLTHSAFPDSFTHPLTHSLTHTPTHSLCLIVMHTTNLIRAHDVRMADRSFCICTSYGALISTGLLAHHGTQAFVLVAAVVAVRSTTVSTN